MLPNVPRSRFRRAAAIAGVAALAVASARTSAAQGTAGSQGFGYPTGQLGSRASASMGALTEFDETTPLNPSALLGWRNAGVHFQYEPEFRTTEANGATIRTAVNRVPVVLAALPVGSRAVIALSLSSLLDRTWGTDVVNRQLVGAESLYVNSISTSGVFALTPMMRSPSRTRSTASVDIITLSEANCLPLSRRKLRKSHCGMKAMKGYFT